MSDKADKEIRDIMLNAITMLGYMMIPVALCAIGFVVHLFTSH